MSTPLRAASAVANLTRPHALVQDAMLGTRQHHPNFGELAWLRFNFG
jgi:hypothetical protein